MTEDPTTLAHRIAAAQAQDAPTPQHVERTGKKIQRTTLGAALGAVVCLACLGFAWKALALGTAGLILVGVLLMVALFAGGLMDADTLIRLVEILRKKGES
jgi:hypothetical protein